MAITNTAIPSTPLFQQAGGVSTTPGAKAPPTPPPSPIADVSASGSGNVPMPSAPKTPAKPVVVSTAKPALKDLQTKQTKVNELSTGIQNQSAAKAAADKAALEAKGTDTTNNTSGLASGAAAGSMKWDSNSNSWVPSAPSADDVAKSLVSQFGGEVKATSTAVPSEDDSSTVLASIQTQTDEASRKFQESMDDLRQGLIPLTVDQQAQVDATNQRYNSLLASAKTAMQNQQAGTQEYALSSGLSYFSPMTEISNVQNVINTNMSKMADIESQASDAIVKLKQAFTDQNYKSINDQYNALTKYLSDKATSISNIQKAAADAQAKVDQYNLDVAKFEEKQAQDKFDNSIKSSQMGLDGKKQALDEYIQKANLTEKQKQDAIDNYYKGVEATIKQANLELDKKKEAFSEESGGDPLGIYASHPSTVNDIVDSGVADQTANGLTYVDLTKYTGDAKGKAEALKIANKLHLPVISSTQEAQALTKIDAGTQNLQDIKDMFQKIAPANAGDKIGDTLTNWAKMGLDTPQGQFIKAYNDFISTQVPGLVQSVGGVNRVNKNEIEAFANALPSIKKGNMDTWADAQLKIDHLLNAIGNSESAAFKNKLVYTDPVKYYQKATPDQQTYFNKIKTQFPDWTPDDVMQYINVQNGVGTLDTGKSDSSGSDSSSFNSVGGDTNSASKIASAIKTVESSGNYEARGGSGEYGAYQFMPSSWSSWAGKYLGDPSAKMTPENQDKVAEAKIQDLIDQGYNARQVALIWNGGQPIEKKGVNKYGVAYDSGGYANKVLKNLI